MDTWTSVGQMFGINTKEPPSLMSIYRYFYNSGENKYEFGFKVPAHALRVYWLHC